MPYAFSSGLLFIFLANILWGVMPLFWKLLAGVPAQEILCHRVIWSVLFLGLLSLRRPYRREFKQVRRHPRQLLPLLGTATLISFNWGLYVYAVNQGNIVETSLGYFISPLINVLLGTLFLGERLSFQRSVAVALAAVGVAFFVWRVGVIPKYALALACSFSLYGLLRKKITVSPTLSLTLETALVAPLALALLGIGYVRGINHLGAPNPVPLLLMSTGVVTAIPLLCFSLAAQRLPLSTLGFYQYLSPSLQLLIGTLWFKEPFGMAQGFTFGCIWTALVVYTLAPTRAPETGPMAALQGASPSKSIY